MHPTSLIRDLSVIAEEVGRLRKPKAASRQPPRKSAVPSPATPTSPTSPGASCSLAGDPAKAKAIAGRPLSVPAGRGRNGVASATRRPDTTPAAQSHRIDSGVVTEEAIAQRLPRGLTRSLLGGRRERHARWRSDQRARPRPQR